MSNGSRVEGEAVVADDIEHDAGGTAELPGAGAQRARSILASGRPDPRAVAQVVQAHPAERTAILSLLHASAGNAYVQQVLTALPTMQAAPSVLGFDNPFDFNRPGPPKHHDKLSKEEDLQAIATRGDIEAMLMEKGESASTKAAGALDLLVNLPDGVRAKVIDGLADKAFDNLIDRVAEGQRERFTRLVDVSTKPERKLRLWAEAHKSRATNDVTRLKGDIGAPIPKYTDDEGQEWTDGDAEEEIRSKLTKDQLRNRKRHLRREAAAEATHGEVDLEVEALTAKAKQGQLTLADVDKMRERKELEYAVEQKHNINLTAQTAKRAQNPDKGEHVYWKPEELKEVDRTLGRLDHAHDPDSFSTIERQQSHGPFDTTGGVHSGDRIEIKDAGSRKDLGFTHGGDKREGVSDDFKKQHGEKIGTLEFVLTHEIGHDYADKHDEKFEKFRKVAGWEMVQVDALRADGVTEEDIATLEARRPNPNAKMRDISGKTKIYSPIIGSTQFWAIPITSVPAQDESNPDVKGGDAWSYSRVNPAEHFAEVYAKAVHVPEKLYDDLITKPTAAAERARNLYDQTRRRVQHLEADPKASNKALELANLKAILGRLKREKDDAEIAQKQRAEQFAVMRNDVFGTDKAVKLSLQRLQAKKVSSDKLENFKERAAQLSTPEQIAFLEAEVSK